MLERTVESGRVAVMQIGRWRHEIESEREICATLASNLFAWAGL
jgi:hypothetical protein